MKNEVILDMLRCLLHFRKWRKARTLTKTLDIVFEKEGFSELHQSLLAFEKKLYSEIHKK